jgi:hypothetical protein
MEFLTNRQKTLVELMLNELCLREAVSILIFGALGPAIQVLEYDMNDVGAKAAAALVASRLQPAVVRKLSLCFSDIMTQESAGTIIARFANAECGDTEFLPTEEDLVDAFEELSVAPPEVNQPPLGEPEGRLFVPSSCPLLSETLKLLFGTIRP